jgi:hypothetical protein
VKLFNSYLFRRPSKWTKDRVFETKKSMQTWDANRECGSVVQAFFQQ